MMLKIECSLNFFKDCNAFVKMGAVEASNEDIKMRTPKEPSEIRILSRKSGNVKRDRTRASTRKIPLAIKTLLRMVLSSPSFCSELRRDTSLRNVLAKAAIGKASIFAKLASGSTAPSSEGLMYLGTSHNPTKALSASAVLYAQNSITEYHQKSPILECNALAILRIRVSKIYMRSQFRMCSLLPIYL